MSSTEETEPAKATEPSKPSSVTMADKKADIIAAAKKLQEYTRPILDFISVALPIVITYSRKFYAYYLKLPRDQLEFIIGTIFCFFGGIYPTLFAAIEAAKHGGLKTLSEACGDLATEATKIIEASKKDDDVDDDGDGVVDVDQITSTELLVRKMNIVVVKMNPEKVDKALGAIYKVWLSVVAVLTLKFAATIALAVTMSDYIKKPLNRYLAPVIQAAVPNEYDRWVPVLIGWFTKGVAISVAWFIQSIMSAFTSALTGSLMMSRALLKMSRTNGWTFGGLIPENHEDTNIDEYISYGFATLGFYVQFLMRFDMPFPFNILLLPFEIAEVTIRWAITN